MNEQRIAGGLDSVLESDFGSLPELVRLHARERGDKTAVIDPTGQLTFTQFDALVDRVAAGMQRDGIAPRDVIAVCAANSIRYAAVFVAALRIGAAVAPLAPTTTADGLKLMLSNCGAKLFFLDDRGDGAPVAAQESDILAVALDSNVPFTAFDAWLTPTGTRPEPVQPDPKAVFNIIYSSGTTGTPKGIVHTNELRWPQIANSARNVYRPEAITLVSTPLYSNTTLVSFLPALGGGGTVVLMPKFDAGEFLRLAEQHRVTHAMLVPVQYRRILEHPEFDRFDLSSFQAKFATSAPFSAELKAEVLKRWPGGLTEFYGMTEGGGSCVLVAHEHPDKLHTVGRPMNGHDIRIISEDGKELGPGEIGEMVGHSPFMMIGYNREPEKTAQTVWHDASGKPFIRTGDIGRFDEDGFLTIMDRAKDMIISGGFNIYPSDLEAVIVEHEAVKEVAVIGVPSDRWGETPVAAIVLNPGAAAEADEIMAWANERLGKTQRITAAYIVRELPRNDIGKVSKRHLRDDYTEQSRAS